MEVVGEAGNGQEALQKIGELQPDVVLMDINMPQMDGITATEKPVSFIRRWRWLSSLSRVKRNI